MLKALIFDVDGTLADTERQGHRVAYNRAFREKGLDWRWDETLYGQLLKISGGKERLRYFIETFQPTFKPPVGGIDRFIGELHRLKNHYYASYIKSGAVKARPGVLRLMREAHEAGVLLAIATTTTPENVYALLKASFDAQAPSWFQVIAAGDVVKRKKPAPDVYHYVLEKLELAAEQCLAVEDSQNGLRAAHAAGIPTLVTVNDYTRQEDFSGALAVVEHLGESNQRAVFLSGNAPLNGLALLDIASLQDLHGHYLKTSHHKQAGLVELNNRGVTHV